jgi:hypothetical protein
MALKTARRKLLSKCHRLKLYKCKHIRHPPPYAHYAALTAARPAT